jgi:hypothetical protein
MGAGIFETRRPDAEARPGVNVGDLYEYAARCADEFACFPDDDEARDRVERAWRAIEADYFGTLRAVIAKADAQAGSATSVYDAMIRVAQAAARVSEKVNSG